MSNQRVSRGQHSRLIWEIAWQQDRELLITPAPNTQRRLAVLAQPAREDLEHLVADGVAEYCIDVSQILDDDEQHRARPRLAGVGWCGFGTGRGQCGVEVAAAGKPGDAVLADDLRGERAAQSGADTACLAMVFDRAFHRGMQLGRWAGFAEELEHLRLVD